MKETPSWQVTKRLVFKWEWPELSESEDLDEGRVPTLGLRSQFRPDCLSGPPLKDVWGRVPGS